MLESERETTDGIGRLPVDGVVDHSDHQVFEQILHRREVADGVGDRRCDDVEDPPACVDVQVCVEPAHCDGGISRVESHDTAVEPLGFGPERDPEREAPFDGAFEVDTCGCIHIEVGAQSGNVKVREQVTLPLLVVLVAERHDGLVMRESSGLDAEPELVDQLLPWIPQLAQVDLVHDHVADHGAEQRERCLVETERDGVLIERRSRKILAAKQRPVPVNHVAVGIIRPQFEKVGAGLERHVQVDRVQAREHRGPFGGSGLETLHARGRERRAGDRERSLAHRGVGVRARGVDTQTEARRPSHLLEVLFFFLFVVHAVVAHFATDTDTSDTHAERDEETEPPITEPTSKPIHAEK